MPELRYRTTYTIEKPLPTETTHTAEENQLRRELERLMTLPPHDNTGWHSQSVCGQMTVAAETPEERRKTADLWFSETIDGITHTPREAEAAELCWTCPVRRKCLKYACDTEQEHGTWGGIPSAMLKAHEFKLVDLLEEKNPFLTDDIYSPYHKDRLRYRGRPKKINPNPDQAAA